MSDEEGFGVPDTTELHDGNPLTINTAAVRTAALVNDFGVFTIDLIFVNIEYGVKNIPP